MARKTATVEIDTEDWQPHTPLARPLPGHRPHDATALPLHLRGRGDGPSPVHAPGADHTETFTCESWHEVQERMRKTENALEESPMDRHHRCADDQGNPTAEACDFCER